MGPEHMSALLGPEIQRVGHLLRQFRRDAPTRKKRMLPQIRHRHVRKIDRRQFFPRPDLSRLPLEKAQRLRNEMDAAPLHTALSLPTLRRYWLIFRPASRRSPTSFRTIRRNGGFRHGMGCPSVPPRCSTGCQKQRPTRISPRQADSSLRARSGGWSVRSPRSCRPAAPGLA